MPSLTIGTKIAWQIAASEATDLRQLFLEPLHLLIGICSIEKLLSAGAHESFDLPPGGLASLRLEWETVAGSFTRQKQDPSILRRAARAASGEGNYTGPERDTIRRSPATHAIFTRAEALTEELDRPFLGLPCMLCALLDGDEGDSVARLLEQRGTNAKVWVEDLRVSFSGLKGAVAVAEAEAVDSASALKGQEVEIGATIAADATLFRDREVSGEAAQRLGLLYELPLRLAEEQQLEPLLQCVVKRLIEVIPGAVRGALLLRDRTSGRLLLKAHLPEGDPPVSLTLAQRAIDQGAGFIWRQSEESSASVKEMAGLCGMYAPLVWMGDVLGVVCIDNPNGEHSFTQDDLELLLAVARYAAMAVTNRNQQEALKQNAKLLSRLLTSFSPKLRERLLERARHGKFRPGGEKSEVTILCSDIRGFTRISASMAAEEVVEMLNDYLPALVGAIFQFDGTVDKFVGDAILAVFGSPEPDAKQHENAVRAAVEMQAAMKSINARREQQGLATCRIGIGIHSGEVLHGFIGAAERMEFTIIGDAVNKASRYCDGAQAGETIISPQVHQHAWRMLEADKTAIATKHEGDLAAYRIRGIRGKTS